MTFYTLRMADNGRYDILLMSNDGIATVIDEAPSRASAEKKVARWKVKESKAKGTR
jgi:hypothetical protein